MTPNDILQAAIEIAVEAHKGQLDKSDQLYIAHPLRLMSKFLHWEYQVVAVLHDVLEDTDYAYGDLQEMGIPSNLLYAVELLSKEEGQSYTEFIDRIVSSNNAIAIAVKLADLEDNMRFDRCKAKGMYDRYIPAWRKLAPLRSREGDFYAV